MSETRSAIIEDRFDESIDFGDPELSIGFQQVALPDLVPVPRPSGEIIIISAGTSDPEAVTGIRTKVDRAVDIFSDKHNVWLPKDDAVLVASELVTNAIRLPRKLTSCALEYIPKPRIAESQRQVGRLVLLVSDNQPGFTEDPNRRNGHRGLAVVTKLSLLVGQFTIPGVRGKTIFAEFEATRRQDSPIHHPALQLDVSGIE